MQLYITNRDRSVNIPYGEDGEEMLQWMRENYPYSNYHVIEIDLSRE